MEAGGEGGVAAPAIMHGSGRRGNGVWSAAEEILCLEVLSIQFQAKGMLKGRPAVEHTVSFDS